MGAFLPKFGSALQSAETMYDQKIAVKQICVIAMIQIACVPKSEIFRCRFRLLLEVPLFGS